MAGAADAVYAWRIRQYEAAYVCYNMENVYEFPSFCDQETHL